ARSEPWGDPFRVDDGDGPAGGSRRSGIVVGWLQVAGSREGGGHRQSPEAAAGRVGLEATARHRRLSECYAARGGQEAAAQRRYQRSVGRTIPDFLPG